MSRVTAKVTVSLTIDCGQPWGGDATMGQIMKQAKSSAEGTLRRVLSENSNRGIHLAGEIKYSDIVVTGKEN